MAQLLGVGHLAAAVQWYELGMISQGKASELAGVSRQEFLLALSRFKISPSQVTPEELAREAYHQGSESWGEKGNVGANSF